jgi:Bacteriocin-protection, YdeI or OmpD-Associated/Domain of unknown function (DUF1905)
MPAPAPKIRFKARILLQEAPAKGRPSAFLVLPASASAKLSTRGSTTVEGAINGHAFKAVLQPDGQRSHWLKLTAGMLKGAAAGVDEEVTLEITPASKEMESVVPPDFRKALSGNPVAKALWTDITPIARRDWILWITTAKQAETRARRIQNACNMLAAGKRRVCCFDRSGFYSKSLSAPRAPR